MNWLPVIIALGLLVRGVTPDEGDGFSNNLITDVTPFLTLLGERLSTQFLAFSLGWPDCFAMALLPRGLFTAVAAAIRVSGYPWLKAVIGRSREPRALAEFELMSSTSCEVSEGLKGGEIVRAQGLTKVKELIFILPEHMSAEGPITKRVRIAQISSESPDECHDTDAFRLTNPSIWESVPLMAKLLQYLKSARNWVGKIWSVIVMKPSRGEEGPPQPHPVPLESVVTAADEEFEITIARNTDISTPNIILNRPSRPGRLGSLIVALIGFLLTVFVITWSALTVFHRPTMMKKDGKVPKPIWFYLQTTGSAVMFLGVAISARIVELCTEESNYVVGPGLKAHLVWLQQESMVNDQLFPSAIFHPKHSRRYYTTSTRRDDVDYPFFQRWPWFGVQAAACVSPVLSFVGYVMHFTGLRGLHYSVSLSLFAGALFMSALRSYIRLPYAKDISHAELPPNFELDWFVLRLGDPRRTPWHIPSHQPEESQRLGRRTSESSAERQPTWAILTGLRSKAYTTLAEGHPKGYSQLCENSTVIVDRTSAHGAMLLRRDLVRLTRWCGPMTEPAVWLARAMELLMCSFPPPMRGPGRYTWTLQVESTSSGSHRIQPVHFRVLREYPFSKWRVFADELDAALSLWLFTNQQRSSRAEPKYPQSPLFLADNDEWLHHGRDFLVGGLRVLGPCNGSLRYEIRRCLPEMPIGLREVKLTNDKTPPMGRLGWLRVYNWGIFGYGHPTNEPPTDIHGRVAFTSSLNRLENAELGRKDHALLGYLCGQPLETLMALDMFASFVHAFARIIKTPVVDVSNVRYTQQALDFDIDTSRLLELADLIANVTKTTVSDILYTVIPGLSAQGKMINYPKCVEIVLAAAGNCEKKAKRASAGEKYIALFRTASKISKDIWIYLKSVAILIDFLRFATDRGIGCRPISDFSENETIDQGCEVGNKWLKGTQTLEEVIMKELETVDEDLLFEIKNLYSEQGRDCTLAALEDPKRGPAFERKPYLNMVRSQRIPPTMGESTADLLGWTALYYAAAQGETRSHLWNEADLNARDVRGYTPLHYACIQINPIRSIGLLPFRSHSRGTKPASSQAVTNRTRVSLQ